MGCAPSKDRSSHAQVAELKIETVPAEAANQDDSHNDDFFTADVVTEVPEGELSDEEYDLDSPGPRPSRACNSTNGYIHDWDQMCDSAGRTHSAPFWRSSEQPFTGPWLAARRESDKEADPDSYLASEEELGQLAEMRQQLGGLLQERGIASDDAVVGNLAMLRFLRANAGDGAVLKACVQFEAMLRWRRDNKVDELRQKVIDMRFPEILWGGHHDVCAFLPSHIWAGLDNHGDILVFERTGAFDVPAFLAVYTPADLELFNLWHLEWMNHQLYLLSRKHNRMVRFNKTIDLKGLTFGMVTSHIGLLRGLLHVAQNYYPELLARACVVHAPRIFSMAWGLIKGSLNARTQMRVAVMSSNFEDEMGDRVAPDSLPRDYGGTREVTFGAFPRLNADDAKDSMEMLKGAKNPYEWGDFASTIASRAS